MGIFISWEVFYSFVNTTAMLDVSVKGNALRDVPKYAVTYHVGNLLPCISDEFIKINDPAFHPK